jgi:type VI secretion system protein ImpJ
MAGRSIHWHDGMFMWPHHMQQEERFRSEEAAQQNKWNVHYNWGLRSIKIDLDALKNHRLVIHSLRARLRDGTVIDAPEDGPLPSLDLKESLAGAERVTVYLALPKLRENQPNVAGSNGPLDTHEALDGSLGRLETRFRLDTMDLEDENSGVDPQPLAVRRLNIKLLLENDDRAGYEALPILSVQKTAETLRLDETYIPPILACDAWAPLHVVILQGLYDRIGSRLYALAKQVETRNITFDSRNAGDAVLLGQLATLNEAYAVLNTVAFAEGVHPLSAYVELCRFVGQMAVYQPGRSVPTLPRYDHDDLGPCFTKVLQHMQAIEVSQAEYIERQFVGEGLRMQVALENRWLETAYQMFVGVSSQLKSDDVIRLLTKSGQLDMKIGSADKVDRIHMQGLPGLEFKAVDRPPRDLPSSPNLTYFQINRDARKEDWLNVQRASKIAIRLNQNRVVVNDQGTIQGQTTITAKLAGTATTTLQFVLYIVPRQS